MARTNFAVNPSFEVWTAGAAALPDGWTKTGNEDGTPTYSRVAGLGARPYAFRTQYTSAADANKAWQVDITHTAVGSFAAGDKVSTSILYTLAATGCVARIGFTFWNAADAYLNYSQSGGIPVAATPTLMKLENIACPANTSRINVFLTVDNLHTGDTFDWTVDELLIEKAAAVGSYFDGDTSGAYSAWSGVRDASTSLSDPPAAGAYAKTLKLNTDFWGT